jgi:hypothetical protein
VSYQLLAACLRTESDGDREAQCRADSTDEHWDRVAEVEGHGTDGHERGQQAAPDRAFCHGLCHAQRRPRISGHVCNVELVAHSTQSCRTSITNGIGTSI